MVTFARSEADIARSAVDAEAVLSQAPAGWLAELIDQAGRETADLLRPPAGGHHFPLREEVRVRRAVRGNYAVFVLIDYEGSSPNGIFGAAELELEAGPAGLARTRMSLSARFTSYAERDIPGQALIEVAEEYTRRLASLVAAHNASRPNNARPKGEPYKSC